MTIFVYPADYFDHTCADGFYEQERAYAHDVLGCPVVLIDFDEGHVVNTFGIDNVDSSASQESVVYRGWQVSPERYKNEIYPLLSRFGVPITSPAQYKTLHASCGYMPYVEHTSPAFIEMDFGEAVEPANIISVFKQLGNIVFVKDYAKSVSGITCLCADNSVKDIIKALHELRDRRGDDFAGGFVFKAWHTFTEQVRIFVVGGEPVLLVSHAGVWNGDIPDNIPTSLPSSFYTVDMGRDSISGQWLVVECGDGQVSDAEDMTSVEVLYRALLAMSR